MVELSESLGRVRLSADAYFQSPSDSKFNALHGAIVQMAVYCRKNAANLEVFLAQAKAESAKGPNETERKALKDFLATAFGNGLIGFYSLVNKLPERCKALRDAAVEAKDRQKY